MAEEVRNLCHPVSPAVSVIPMGVDFQHTFVPSSYPKKPFSLIFVGRLVEKKGVTYLIDALPAILEKFPETHLTIIGTGPELTNLRKQVEHLRLHQHVEFLGAVINTDLPNHYQQNQIAVFPFVIAENGDREGLPVVISEAIGCGCCVVTTNLLGIDDLIIDKHSGLLVAPKNSNALANTIIKLFSDPDKIDHYSSTSYERTIKTQDMNSIAINYATLINSMVNT